MGGRKTFVTNTVLTAADVQDFLMDQAVMGFPTTAARGSAIASPTEGMVSYLNDSNMIESYSGTAWQRQSGGLVPVRPTSVNAASGSGSFTQTGVVTFTNVGTRLSLNGVFTSEFRNYRMVMTHGAGNTDNVTVALRFRNAGTDSASGYYFGGTRVNAIGGASTVWFGNNVSSIDFGQDRNASINQGWSVFDIANPQVTGQTATTFQSITFGGSNGFYMINGSGNETATVSFDGLSIIWGSGTHSGTIQVFGYKDN
jgi:hypothetical protein